MFHKRLFVGGIYHGTRHICNSCQMRIMNKDGEPDDIYTESRFTTISDRFADDGKTIIARAITGYKVMLNRDWTNRLWDHETRKEAEREIIAMLCVDAYRIDILEGDELRKHLAMQESNEHEEETDD